MLGRENIKNPFETKAKSVMAAYLNEQSKVEHRFDFSDIQIGTVLVASDSSKAGLMVISVKSKDNIVCLRLTTKSVSNETFTYSYTDLLSRYGIVKNVNLTSIFK